MSYLREIVNNQRQNLKIVSTAVYEPKNKVQTQEYMRSRTGLLERVVSAHDETHYTMAKACIESALAKSSKPIENPAIIVATNTTIPGHIPSVASDSHLSIVGKLEARKYANRFEEVFDLSPKAEFPAMDIIYNGGANRVQTIVKRAFDVSDEEFAYKINDGQLTVPSENIRCLAHIFTLENLAERLANDFKGAEDLSFEVTSGCASYNVALALAHGIQHQKPRPVIVVGVDRMTAIANPDDKSSNDLFGDLASCAVLHPCNSTEGFLVERLYTDSSAKDLITIKKHNDRDVFSQEHKRVYCWAVRTLQKNVVRALSDIGRFYSVANLTFSPKKGRIFIGPHQGNPRMIEEAFDKDIVLTDALGKEHSFSIDGALICAERTGNTSTASLGQAIHHFFNGPLYRNGKILRPYGSGEEIKLRTGDLIISDGIGAGLTYGYNVYRFID